MQPKDIARELKGAVYQGEGVTITVLSVDEQFPDGERVMVEDQNGRKWSASVEALQNRSWEIEGGYKKEEAGIVTSLEQITQTLIDLRKQTEAADMQKAELFAQVKNGKLYVEEYDTFADYCESIGYTRQYVYMLIRIYNLPIVGEAQPEIGTMAANAIVSIAKKLKLINSEIAKLIGYAKEHTAKETADHCQQVKLIVQTSEPNESDELTLPKALAKQTQLLQRRGDLESELDEINKELHELGQIIQDLSA